MECNLVWNHTRDFKIARACRASSIWNPKLHDPKFNYHYKSRVTSSGFLTDEGWRVSRNVLQKYTRQWQKTGTFIDNGGRINFIPILRKNYGLLVGRSTIGLPSYFQSELSHVQWAIPQSRREGSTFFSRCRSRCRKVKIYVAYVNKWSHLFYVQTYRPANRSQ